MKSVQASRVRELPSASEPEWQREELRRWWDPSRQLIRSIRRYQAAVAKGGLSRTFVSRYWVLQHRFWSVICGADIPINVKAEGGLLLPHPNGIVIHPSVRIGVNCAIFQQVTMVGDIVVGGQVEIGAGAKIIRAVTIGDRAVVGANAVVLKDVPAGVTVVGIPATPIVKP